MAKRENILVDKDLMKKSNAFMKKIDSKMYFESNLASDLMTFDWIDEIEFACPYIDNIIRNPKLSLISEEDIVKIAKAKKITVESVKDLSRNTHYIEKIDKKNNDVQPSKILIERSEETFNIYENRFIYTLIDNLTRFMMKREALLEDIETKSDKILEYAATTETSNEKINIELKISSKELPKGKTANDLKKEIATIKSRMKIIKDYMKSWQKSEFIKQLDKAHASFVVAPIRKTNIILKNPNFQFAMKLWNFLRSYDLEDEDNSKEGLNTMGNEILKGILDDAFLMNYYCLDSISSSKREEKDKLSKYAVLIIKQQVKRAISLLLNSGIEISEEELLDMLSIEIKKEKSKMVIGKQDVKEKFGDIMDEYLERTENYL